MKTELMGIDYWLFMIRVHMTRADRAFYEGDREKALEAVKIIASLCEKCIREG